MLRLRLPLAAFFLTVHSASAAVVSFDATFAAGNNGPINPVTGSFQVSFDNSVSFTDRADLIRLDALNIDLGSDIGASYFIEHDVLVIGGTQFGVASVAQHSYDFWLVVADVSNEPVFRDPFGAFALVYSQGGPIYFAGEVVGDIHEVAAPDTVALLGLGLASLGLTRRRKAEPERLTPRHC